jgi:hypothetical protein
MHLGMHHGRSCRCIIGHTWQSSRGRGFKALLSWGRHARPAIIMCRGDAVGVSIRMHWRDREMRRSRGRIAGSRVATATHHHAAGSCPLKSLPLQCLGCAAPGVQGLPYRTIMPIPSFRKRDRGETLIVRAAAFARQPCVTCQTPSSTHHQGVGSPLCHGRASPAHTQVRFLQDKMGHNPPAARGMWGGARICGWVGTSRHRAG